MPKKEAIINDLDGVVISRIPVQNKAIKAFPKIAYHFLTRSKRTGLYRPLPDKLVVARTISEEPVRRGKEAVNLWFHGFRRGVMPEARAALQQKAQTADIYGSTGRHAKRGWVDETKATLREGGVLDLFKGIDFTPEGSRGVQSKAETIERLAERYGVENMEFNDDNPFDALPIAERFPELRVNIIQDLTTGILFTREEREKYPNVRRVARLGAPRD